MRNRLILVGLTIVSLTSLVVIDYLLPWPALCVLLTLTLILMSFHTLWLIHAQHSDRHKLKTCTESSWQPSVDILIPAKNESKSY
jgi:uncharacterized membrane protein YphA (DoxX/SURF4 family)